MAGKNIRALGPLRHACLSCGGSCQGALIRLHGKEERRRILKYAKKLGIPKPLEGDRLRLDEGRCVFLSSERRCRLHERYGPDVKPAVCRQYPRVLVAADTETRAGIDPGCYTAHVSWREGPEASLTPDLMGSAVELDPEQQQVERAFLALARKPGATVGSLLRALCPAGEGGQANRGLPPGFAGRLIEAMQQADFQEVLAQPECGDAMRGTLGPVIAKVCSLEASEPPPWPVLSPAEDAWAVESTRRMVYLRLAAEIPWGAGIALLVLSGAVICAWADPEPDAFGPALASWNRAIRAQPFWARLLPDQPRLQWLAQG